MVVVAMVVVVGVAVLALVVIVVVVIAVVVVATSPVRFKTIVPFDCAMIPLARVCVWCASTLEKTLTTYQNLLMKKINTAIGIIQENHQVCPPSFHPPVG